MIHRLVVPLTFAAVVLFAAQALAQGAFPAPLPDQAAQGNASPDPWVSGAIPFSSAGGALAPFERRAPDGCGQGFAPLREEAEKRGKLIKAASDRRAPPDEACKLIMGFGQAEIKMIKYVQTNAV